MRYWLMKSEPESFSIDDLKRVTVEPWSGVRSMFARMHMRAMSVGDAVLFYHSNATPPGVAGLAKVERVAVVDETQFDPSSQYFDGKATREKPVWDCVDVRFVAKFPYYIGLPQLRADQALADMVLLKPGRLSVQPVGEHEYHHIVELGHLEPPPLEPAKARPAKAKAKPKPNPKKLAPKPTPTPTPNAKKKR